MSWALLVLLFIWACSPFITNLGLQNGQQRHMAMGFNPYGLLLLVDIQYILGFGRYLLWVFG